MNSVQVEPINADYEYLQYNEHLKIIHSIKDDMYQMQSIINACQSNKQAYRWKQLVETKEIIEELMEQQNCCPEDLLQNRTNIEQPQLQGYYVHRLLVNDVACWASRKYAIYIAKLLDNYFEQERAKQQQIIEELKPRAVPEENKNDYRYLIYKEVINREGFIRLHLSRRHKSTFRKVINHYNNDEERYYFKDDLPVAMTPNLHIKTIIKKTFGSDDYKIANNGNAVDIKIEHLPRLYELIDKYFKDM